jgi:hypothetical protein
MRQYVPLVLLLSACSTAPAPSSVPAQASATSPGSTRETAIEVCKPTGERDYLRRLRCADGSAPEFSRNGSYGTRTPMKSAEDEKMAQDQALGGTPVPPGGPDFHVLDVYEIRCGDTAVEVFIDMYHCDQPPPAQAPAGFTIVP